MQNRPVPLERNILVRDRPRPGVRVFGLRHALVEIVAAAAAAGGRAARAAAGVSAAAFTAAAEQDQIAGHHFGHIFFLAAGLVVQGKLIRPDNERRLSIRVSVMRPFC
jgi:hypothetical protein